MGFAQNAVETVFDADALHPEFTDCGFHNRPYHGVQSRRIAAACQDSDLFIHISKQKLYFTLEDGKFLKSANKSCSLLTNKYYNCVFISQPIFFVLLLKT